MSSRVNPGAERLMVRHHPARSRELVDLPLVELVDAVHRPAWRDHRLEGVSDVITTA
jgi:hypothetical protein